MFKVLVVIFLSLLTLKSNAAFTFLNRSSEGLMMGDAFLTLADDEMTLFYNPAALGRNRGISLIPLKPIVALPDVLDKELSLNNPSIGISDRFKDFPDEPELIADRLLGYPVYFELGAAPAVKMLNFGFNLFAVQKTSLDLQNAIHPVLNVDYRLDRGFIAGYALYFGNGGSGRNPQGHRSTLGLGLKTMNRQGFSNTLDLFGTDILDIIQDVDNFQDIRRGLGYSKGSGFGFDLGYEYNYFKGPTRVTFGLSWLDIGDTSFSLDEGTQKVPVQAQSLNFGTSWNQDFGPLDYSLAVDYSNVLDTQSAGLSKLKIGARARFPLFSLYTGWNGGYTSFGLGLNLFLLDIKIGFYGVELGRTFRQEEGKRTVITISLAEIGLDAF